MDPARESLRELPSVDRLLGHSRTEALLERFSRRYVTRHCRNILDELRTEIRRGGSIASSELSEASIVARLERRITAEREPRLTRVVNATGTLLHTNLGRALLPQAAIDAISRVAGHPVNLEYDLTRGERGQREEAVERLLVALTGAEAATVVNNNAAAVLVALNTLASAREVVVSRGELIEIGGAFRLPEVMEKSGAILKEVGTTNRTHPGDYQRAIGPQTGLLLKVHTSNYKIVGFSSDVTLGELVAIGKQHDVPVMEDLGSGALVDLSRYALPKEPVVAERLALGTDVVTFSGDKVLGGPQAGLVVGKKHWISQISRNPLHRAVRCGKLTIAALEATLKLYQESGNLAEDVPTLRTFVRPIAELDRVAERVIPVLQRVLGDGFRLTVEDSTAQIGSGALPTEELPSKIIAVENEEIGAERIASRFRSASPPILGRIKDGRFLLDLRTIFDPEDLIPRSGGEVHTS